MPEKRVQWIFVKPCDCPVGVMEAYLADTEEGAFAYMYEGEPLKELDARRRGIRAKRITFSKYNSTYYEKMSPRYNCPHASKS